MEVVNENKNLKYADRISKIVSGDDGYEIIVQVLGQLLLGLDFSPVNCGVNFFRLKISKFDLSHLDGAYWTLLPVLEKAHLSFSEGCPAQLS